jgi:hypothetical protein
MHTSPNGTEDKVLLYAEGEMIQHPTFKES